MPDDISKLIAFEQQPDRSLKVVPLIHRNGHYDPVSLDPRVMEIAVEKLRERFGWHGEHDNETVQLVANVIFHHYQ